MVYSLLPILGNPHPHVVRMVRSPSASLIGKGLEETFGLNAKLIEIEEKDNDEPWKPLKRCESISFCCIALSHSFCHSVMVVGELLLERSREEQGIERTNGRD